MVGNGAVHALHIKTEAMLCLQTILHLLYILFFGREDVDDVVFAVETVGTDVGGKCGLQQRFEMLNVLRLIILVENALEICETTIGKSFFRHIRFDVKSMNSAIANHLSDDFNYIGFACGFIVFFFLWLSMGSIELAVLSFIPMAISWLWILGLMAIFHMQFNIVNIILATFIFGQGDDYTIFMTEGAMYEYAYRRKMLASYKHSIIISALIMFIGIGTLIVARHPALRSLAEVTIAGMFSVVLMAYIVPPLIFNWLVKHKGEYRVRPLSLQMLFRRRKEGVAYYHDLVLDRYRYKGVEVFSTVKRNLRRNRDYQAWMEQQDTSLPVIIPSAGYGEKALLFALLHPETKVIAVEADPDKCRLMKFSMEGIVENVEIINQAEISRQM